MISDYARLESRVLSLMDGDDVAEDEFNACALEIYSFQRKHNQPYDHYCRHLGTPNSINHWKEIPAVPQSAFKLYPLRSFPDNATVKTFRTSGTTGEGFGSHHFCSLRLYDKAIVRGWDLCRLPNLSQLILIPSPSQAPYSSLSHMMGVLQGRAVVSQQYYTGDSGELRIDRVCESIQNAIQTKSPLLLMGTALAYLHLFEKCGPVALPPGSFALETGGYKGSGRELTKEELYARFTSHFGLRPDNIINEYSMTELSSQFYACGLGHAHQGPPWARALVIDPETEREAQIGGVGTLRIFDLANVGSVAVIQTRDLAIRRKSGFELLGRDPAALPRGCSRAADEQFSRAPVSP